VLSLCAKFPAELFAAIADHVVADLCTLSQRTLISSSLAAARDARAATFFFRAICSSAQVPMRKPAGALASAE
jgi:hypothetical protein